MTHTINSRFVSGPERGELPLHDGLMVLREGDSGVTVTRARLETTDLQTRSLST